MTHIYKKKRKEKKMNITRNELYLELTHAYINFMEEAKKNFIFNDLTFQVFLDFLIKHSECLYSYHKIRSYLPTEVDYNSPLYTNDIFEENYFIDLKHYLEDYVRMRGLDILENGIPIKDFSALACKYTFTNR